MRAGYRILDADRHVIEPMTLWKRYLPPELREHGPTLAFGHEEPPPEERMAHLGPRGALPLPPVLMLDGEPVMRKVSTRARLELTRALYRNPGSQVAGSIPEGQLGAMNRSGVDVAYLLPTYASYLVSIDSMEPARASAFARAYNDWLRDFCQIDPRRLRGAGLMSLHDPAELVRELERILDFGWNAVVLRPNPVKGRLLSDPAYEPFWTACEQHSVAVAIHEGTHARLPTAGADRFQSRFAMHASSHTMEQMLAFLALLEGGVFERHPGLRVAFLEAGCGWLLQWLWRLDAVSFEYMRGEVEENVRLKPSEYFRRQCFVSIEPDEPYLLEVIRLHGSESLLFGSDFPHVDHEQDMVDQLLTRQERLPDEVIRKILWDNPARFFRLSAEPGA